jgi:hypothetical protein
MAGHKKILKKIVTFSVFAGLCYRGINYGVSRMVSIVGDAGHALFRNKKHTFRRTLDTLLCLKTKAHYPFGEAKVFSGRL